MPKPHRVLFDRVSSYADEAAAFMRRRRMTRRPFARISYPDGTGLEPPADSPAATAIFSAASDLIELAGEPAPSRAPR